MIFSPRPCRLSQLLEYQGRVVEDSVSAVASRRTWYVYRLRKLALIGSPSAMICFSFLLLGMTLVAHLPMSKQSSVVVKLEIEDLALIHFPTSVLLKQRLPRVQAFQSSARSNIGAHVSQRVLTYESTFILSVFFATSYSLKAVAL